MANHASHAALPYPIKGARFTVLIPFLDADGDPTDPTTPDLEVSKDDGAVADAAETEASTYRNSVGMHTFSGAELDCSAFSFAGKAASGPKTTLGTLYPRALAEVGTGTLSAGSASGGTLGTLLPYDVTGCFIKTTGGTGGGGTGGANNQARKIVTYNTSSGAFTVVPNWETTPDNTTTYAVLLPEGVTLGMLKALNPTTAGRTLGVEPDGMGHADLKEWLGAAPNALSSGRVEVLLGAVTAGVIAAASFASNALDAVWSTATRILTAGTNIVLAKGTGVTGFNDLSAADIRTAQGLASANLDSQLSAINSKTTNLPTDPADQSLIIAATDALLGYLQGLALAKGTIGATGNTTTTIHVALAYGDNEIRGCLLVLKDVSTGLWHRRVILSNADTGDLITVDVLPFTPEASVDLYWILPFPHLSSEDDIADAFLSDAARARLEAAALQVQLGTVDTTAFTSTATQFESDDIVNAGADVWNKCIGIVTSGALIGIRFKVTDYALTSGRGHFTVTLLDGSSPLPSALANNVTFILLA